MAAKGGAPTASGEPELVEGTSACDGSGAGAGGGISEGVSDVSAARDTSTGGASQAEASPPVPESTQTRAAEDRPSRPSPPPATPLPCPASRATSSPPRSPSSSEGSSSIAVLSSSGDSPESSAVFVVPRSPSTLSLAGTETSPGAASSGKASNSSPNECAGASAREYQRSKSREHAGARPKERSPVSSTPLSPRRAADTISTTSSISMLAQQGSFRSTSDVSFSPSVSGDVAVAPDDTPRRFSGSTEDDGERERHHGGHWHLPFRKKMTIEVAKSPPKSVSFLDEVDPGSPLASEFGEEHHKEHHRSFGHAISHSSLGRAMSHSSIGHAVSHFFKKGHHSPPSSEGAKRNSAPGAVGAGGAGLRSSQSHHSIGHVVAEFFKKGVHHHSSHETISTGRSGTPPIEVGEDVVSSLPSGPDEGDSRNESSTPVSGRRAASTSAISAASGTPSKSPNDQQLRENASTGSNMGHAVAKAFKKFNASIVGSPGKPPRWKTWRRGGEQDPRALRDRRRSLPGRRLSESAAIASYETSMLSLLRRRRSASRSPDRRVRSPKARSPGRDHSPPPRETALQRLRRQALRRHLGVMGFLHLRRWRSSCPDLSKLEQERVNPPIRHVVMRRAIVDELERIVLLYPGDKLKQWFQLFEWEGVNQEDESQIYIKFFKFHKCYDLIPTSAKLVVFDTQLLVKKAFFALVYNGVRAAPLWDSKKQQYVGMLTITDFIRILQMYYRRSDERIEELEEHKLETWRTVLESDSKPLIFIEPEASLFDAITILLENKIHRLPVIDPKSGDVLYIITHKRILRFLCLYLHNLPRPSFLGRTLADLRIGTYDKIETARPDTPVIEALTKFVERRVSALPIVDSDNKLTHIYAKFDVINLAAEKTYNNLNVPLMTANSHRSENKVEACRLSDTLMQVLEKIVHAEVHRLVITDDEQRVIGIISLSDILDALVIRPHEYNTLPECNSAGSESGDDERHMIVEEEPGDEEDPVAAAAGIERLSLSDGAHKDG